jgi:hypothetical protein
MMGCSFSEASDTVGLIDKTALAPMADENIVIASLREIADNSKYVLKVKSRFLTFVNP